MSSDQRWFLAVSGEKYEIPNFGENNPGFSRVATAFPPLP
jgi:hypothetical protein